jgi:hypothetical protein
MRINRCECMEIAAVEPPPTRGRKLKLNSIKQNGCFSRNLRIRIADSVKIRGKLLNKPGIRMDNPETSSSVAVPRQRQSPPAKFHPPGVQRRVNINIEQRGQNSIDSRGITKLINHLRFERPSEGKKGNTHSKYKTEDDVDEPDR